jgi:hypothetical protein
MLIDIPFVVEGKIQSSVVFYPLKAMGKTWHLRHDWLFTPFVVVVGGKYFFAGAGVPSF